MKRSIQQRNRQGFTLIELMIVIAIVGILSAVAFGFYGDNVIASNRSEARSTLTEVAGSLEKCRSLYGSYNAAACNVALPQVSDTNYYSISATALAGTSLSRPRISLKRDHCCKTIGSVIPDSTSSQE